MKTARKIALLGENVSQSLSPVMHNRAFAHLGLPFIYEAVSVAPGEFEKTFARMQNTGCSGLNITIPYKEQAVRLIDRLSPTARKLSAVNTVVFSEEGPYGDNTDAAGCLQALREHLQPGAGPASALPQAAACALILGAGGAAKATVEAFGSLGVRRYTVAGRSKERLARFARWFDSSYPRSWALETIYFAEIKLDLSRFSVVVNAAPLESHKEIPNFTEIKFPKGGMMLDWVYNPRKTPWVAKAASAGADCVEGWEMLLYQGMKSFEIWTHQSPPLKIMKNALLEALL